MFYLAELVDLCKKSKERISKTPTRNVSWRGGCEAVDWLHVSSNGR